MAVRYPEATWTGVVVSDATIRSLDRALVTVYLGHPHVSSDVHEQVIARLASTGGADRLLAPMRRAAEAAADALAAGDLPRFGTALVANTDAQAALHAELISADAHRLIALAAEHHALGWKVNGAGGEGGTVTLLADGNPAPLRSAIASSGFAILDLRIARRGVTSGGRVAGEPDWVSAAADP